MRPTRPILAAIALGLLAAGLTGVADSHSERHEREWDEHGRSDHGRRDGWLPTRADVAPVANPTYGEECGACHMAYQPGLLPADAWKRILDPAALADHFGDDATLSEAPMREITDYLVANASDRSDRTRARAFSVGPDAAAGTLPRISQTAYFLRKHHEIPDRMVSANPDVGSFSQCNSCHLDAAEGVYNEHRVLIPGFGPWED